MRKSFLIIWGIFFSCISYCQKTTISNPYAKTALFKSDSIVKSVVGQSVFDKYVKREKHFGYVLCKVSDEDLMFDYDEKFDCKPYVFRSLYYLVEESDTLINFSIEFNADFHFDNIMTNYYLEILIGYGKALGGEFLISYSMVKNIAKQNGMKKKGLILHIGYFEHSIYKHGPYFWVASYKTSTKKLLLHIDPIDGTILYNEEIMIHNIN